VVLHTIEDIPPASKFGLTLFPLFDDLDILTNVLNRPGLFCIKGEDRRARKALSEGADWCQFISGQRAIYTAGQC
jgi:hypothetical protein